MKALTGTLANELDTFDAFLDEQTWSPTTLTFYHYIVSRLAFWMDHEGMPSFEQLEIRHVKAFIARAGWGNSMARKLNSVLLQFVEREFGPDHALLRWKVKREVSAPQRTLDEDQASKLLASFTPGISQDYSNRSRRFTICDLNQPLGIRNYAIVLMLLDTGLRSAEICNLQLQYLNLADRTITAKVKFGKWRTALFSDRTAEALEDWLRLRPLIENTHSAGRLFLGVMNGYDGHPLTPAGMRNMIRKLGKITGLGPLSPHDFRRTFATLAMRSGANVRAIQEAGGWSHPEMVLHYTRAIKGKEILPYLPGNILQLESPSN